jgi:hypothetical protein
VTAQPLFDGTFSSAAVASAAHALVDRLHDEAMATIAELADSWGRPAEELPAVEHDEPVTYREPATWSVRDDEDDEDGDGNGDGNGDGQYGEEDDVRALPLPALPALLPRPRRVAANVTVRREPHPAVHVPGLATAATDEFAVPSEDDRRFAAL